MNFDPSSVKGGATVVAHFGVWPTFHDAEIVRVHLERVGVCSLSIHTFNTTSIVNEAGHFKTKDHGVVTFDFEGIRELQLSHFNEQNVIFGLSISRESDGAFILDIDGCHGMEGTIVANSLCASVEPGIPTDSIYARK